MKFRENRYIKRISDVIHLAMLNVLPLFKMWPLTWLFRQRKRVSDEEAWRQDPLSHPAIRRMTPHELADLPFDR